MVGCLLRHGRLDVVVRMPGAGAQCMRRSKKRFIVAQVKGVPAFEMLLNANILKPTGILNSLPPPVTSHSREAPSSPLLSHSRVA